MKKFLSIQLIILIFVVGIGLILYPSIGNFVSMSTASIEIADYEDTVAGEDLEPSVAARLQAAHLFNEHLYYGTNVEGEDQCLCVNGDVMCYLEIPSINVYLPVYYGTSSEVLQKGCGYITNTSLPVGGENTNCAISGHTGLPGAVLLSDLDKVEIGDYFFIHVLGEVLAYQVCDIETVLPEDTSLVKIEAGRDLVSLVTCTPYGVNTHRLIVRGERTDYVPQAGEEAGTADAVKKGLSDALRRQLNIIFTILASAVAAIFFAIFYDCNSVRKAEPPAPGEQA